MRIKRIEVVPLYAPEAEVAKSTCIIRVETDEGIEGIGQAELPGLIAKAFVETKEWSWYFSPGLAALLKGEDPLQVERLWAKMYSSMWLYGRRGAGLAVLGAIDTALWDIRGKYLGRPLYELLAPGLGVARQEEGLLGPKRAVRVYATVYPSGSTAEEVRRNVSRALEAGFRAVKIEEQPGGLGRGPLALDRELVGAAREALGNEGELMVDYQYVIQSYPEALKRIRAIEAFEPYFVEAPLPPDSLEGYARLSASLDTPIACGDGGFTALPEFLELMERAKVDVVQPSTVRSGGITQIMAIALEAHRRGLLCVPHCYAWMVGVAAGLHLAAVLPNMPLVEMPSPWPRSPLVEDLLRPSLAPKEGFVEVPRRPGLGFELNERALRKYRVEAF
jgi:L-alanine-DL-glutamate epimerase-like enolase superfamily enzyme